MANIYSVYCDESCHLESDGQKSMVLGAVWCPSDTRQEIGQRIREIKAKHGLPSSFEIKWTKVSPAKVDFYLDLVDYFFDNDDLHFRAVVIPDKTVLNHVAHQQTHDQWYYKMHFQLLTAILENSSVYHVFLDIKDTRGGSKIRSLRDVLSNQKYDFERRIIQNIQLIHSHEVAMLQLTDLLIGALMYEHRGNGTSPAKRQLVERIKQRSGLSLTRNTLYKEPKFNLLVWQGQNGDH